MSNISHKEWEANQAHAISKEKLKRILNNTDIDKVRQYAMPRNQRVMSSAKIARAKSMVGQGRTTSEIAEALDVSVSTINEVLNGKNS